MIHLLSAAISYDIPGASQKVVLYPTTIDLPIDRRVAVIGPKRHGKSVFLRLLSGAETPAVGRVISRARLSPVIRAGAIFDRRLTIFENIRFFARMLNVDAEELALTVMSVCGRDGGMAKSRVGETEEQRRAAELALLCVLPFDCYLADEISYIPEAARLGLFKAAARQRAGIIFATNQKQLARSYADCAIVIRDKTLYPFSDVEEAIAFNERRPR
jgi:capsular polysaccharide transport system ATP-binding protein